MRIPTGRGVKAAALAIMLFFAAIALAQYFFVRYQTEGVLESALEQDADELNRDVAYDNGIDPAQFNKSATAVSQYMAVLTDGTVLSYDTGNDPLSPGVFPPVELVPDASKALDGLVEIDSRYDARSKPEKWLLLGRRLDQGFAIVGVSEHDNVPEPLREKMLRQNLAYFGRTLEEAKNTPSRRFDNQISWAVVGGRGNLWNGLGRVPLKTNALEVGKEAGEPGLRQAGSGTYYMKYTTIKDKAGTAVGMGVLFEDARYDAVALRNLAHFDFAVGATSATAFLIALLVLGRRHELEKQEIRDAFQNYFSPQVLDAILRDPQRLKLGGQRREVTVLFSDIRSFTALSEQLPPQQLTRMLQEYFEEMTKAVESTNGVLDKYIGDAVMAFWGAPIEQEDQADRAVQTALDMTRRLEALQDRWIDKGLPTIDIGIGINTGVATVGNFGSEKRFDYTVIGDAVNTASRLEALNKVYGSRVMIAESTKRQLSLLVPVRDLGEVAIRGKERAVRVFEVILRSEGREPTATAPTRETLSGHDG